MLDTMKAVVRNNTTCVLATGGPNGQPHTSLMTYSWSDDGLALYLLTGKHSRKYRYMVDNPKVSLMIDTRAEKSPPLREDTVALTITGHAQEVDGAAQTAAREQLLAINPHLQAISASETNTIMKIVVKEFLLLQGVNTASVEKVAEAQENA